MQSVPASKASIASASVPTCVITLHPYLFARSILFVKPPLSPGSLLTTAGAKYWTAAGLCLERNSSINLHPSSDAKVEWQMNPTTSGGDDDVVEAVSFRNL
mmetsp:Transcript_1890/g.4168  ORF Transcript_1890/g.4168 Transcript_1890/m.4168 type:complete len:101 (+) Transcript_1890:126-428(+)